jgi:hypothetical protein
MHKLAVVAFLLIACKHDEAKPQMPPPEEPEPAAIETKPPPPPPKKVLTPEELGDCKIAISGAVKLEQTSHGGIAATNISYWLSPEDAKKVSGVNGFVVNCHGPDFKLSLVPAGGKEDGMPFGPKNYALKKGKGDVGVMLNLKDGKSFDQANGNVNITAFDKTHIAGTIEVSGKLVPSNAAIKVSGSFDLKCPGLSGCGE